MNSNDNKYDELVSVHQRFKVFLDKLTVRAKELFEETRQSAQEVYNADKNKFYYFKNGIEGQFKSIIKKADEIFEQQIKTPFEVRNNYSNSGFPKIDWKNDECYSNICSEFYDWKDSINDMLFKVFKNVEEQDPEIELQEILKEYEETKNDFHCSQCGSQLPINQVYFIATYIPCEHCSTQNTFVPSTKMSMLEHLSRDVVEGRCKPLKKEYRKYVKKDGYDLDVALTLYLNYRRAILRELNKIVPSLSKQNEEVYFRDMTDMFREYNVNFNDQKSLYHNIIMRMDSFCYVENQKAMNGCLADNELEKAEEVQNKWLWDLGFNIRNIDRISLPNCEFAENMKKNIQETISTVVEPYLSVINLRKEGRVEEAKQISDELYERTNSIINKTNESSDVFCSINNLN